MRTDIPLEKSRSFVASQFHSPDRHLDGPRAPVGGPAITISHQAGAGGGVIAGSLAKVLQEGEPPDTRPWTVFDRQLVELALEEHHLPAALAKRMPEDRRTYIDDVMGDVFGVRPPSWVLVPKVAETIQHLVDAGHVILIGRGSAVVTSRRVNVFHVRLIASLASRVDRVQRRNGWTADAAARYVDREDRARQRYVQANFHTRLDDDLLYDLVINTDRIHPDDAAPLIADAARRSFANHASGSR